MATRSPEGGDKPSNQGLSDFTVLPDQKGVGPRAQKLEGTIFQGYNIPGEQLWRPVMPKDREKIEAFVNNLAQNKEEILDQLRTYLHKPNKTGDEMALGVYLDVAVKRDVFGIDLFASKQPGDEAKQEYREYIAIMATKHVAKSWLEEHPASQLASIISDATIYAPDFIQQGFLYEMWPSVYPRITGDD
jgi:hypothetical protein